LIIGGAPLGLVDDVRAARLARFGTRLFSVGEERVEFARDLADVASRSAAMADVAAALRAEGALPGWRDEPYRVATAFDAPPALLVERGAARYFGIRTWAAHVNGIVRGAQRSTSMWLARRSPTKATDPGLLDNLVGGGIAAGQSVAFTVVKEAWEEAGIGATLAATARATGVVHVRRALPDGLQRETVFAHDLDLPADFRPVNQDGEATEHRLVDVDETAAAIAIDAGADEMTVDASMVVLDFLIRHRRIGSREPLLRPLAALSSRGADDPPSGD
jgi:8-oxo-dGTP pyrophosphatase MutT (NUDIX family)